MEKKEINKKFGILLILNGLLGMIISLSARVEYGFYLSIAYLVAGFLLMIFPRNKKIKKYVHDKEESYKLEAWGD